MTNKRQIRRMLVAGTLSIMLNGILIFLITSVEAEQHRSSIIVKITDALGSPGTGLANWLVPSGHDVAHFLGRRSSCGHIFDLVLRTAHLGDPQSALMVARPSVVTIDLESSQNNPRLWRDHTRKIFVCLFASSATACDKILHRCHDSAVRGTSAKRAMRLAKNRRA